MGDLSYLVVVGESCHEVVAVPHNEEAETYLMVVEIHLEQEY